MLEEPGVVEDGDRVPGWSHAPSFGVGEAEFSEAAEPGAAIELGERRRVRDPNVLGAKARSQRRRQILGSRTRWICLLSAGRRALW